MKKDCDVPNCPLNGGFEHDHAGAKRQFVVVPFGEMPTIDQLRGVKPTEAFEKPLQDHADAVAGAFESGFATMGLMLERRDAGCRCFYVMAADKTRHFRGCPLREKYPTHEAESNDKKMLADLYKMALMRIIERVSAFAKEAGVDDLPESSNLGKIMRMAQEALWPSSTNEPLPSNAWASKEAAPPGAVEHKFQEGPTVFERDLEKHREKIEHLMGPGSHSISAVIDAVFFLLAVAHQPVPADYVPADAVRERFEELDAKVVELSETLQEDFDTLRSRGDHHDDRITELEKRAQVPGRTTAAKTWEAAAKHAVSESQRMVPPKIVVLCGSTRFLEAFRQANLEETLKGNVVLTVGNMMHSDDGQEACVRCRATDRRQPCTKGYSQHQFEKLTSNWHADTKKALDALHFKKIEMADEVLVLNAVKCTRCGVLDETKGDCRHEGTLKSHDFQPYIGESTRNEIKHAYKLNKVIRFLNPHSPNELVMWGINPNDVLGAR